MAREVWLFNASFAGAESGATESLAYFGALGF
jgi:hypothetical protein